jgi:hypothetical protein
MAVHLQPCGKALGIPETALTSYEPELEIGSNLSVIQKVRSIDLFSKKKQRKHSSCLFHTDAALDSARKFCASS